MNIEQSYNNLVNLLMNGRFTLNGSALTAVEHQQINNDLKLLYDRAVKVDNMDEEIGNLRKSLEKAHTIIQKCTCSKKSIEENEVE